ncbi:MAG: TetR/AcrR family transcriptional regulator [Synergistaceae bacterium]|nr:TetR/AcrR family transcriptional regulator [Synergistaceae bacterium]
MRLIEAAIAEFAERGFNAASYNKIIERSGLSKGTVYYYFDNKESLLLTVMDEICQRFMCAVGGLQLPDTKEEYWATNWEYHQKAIRFFFENPSLGRVMFRLSKDEPCFCEQLKDSHERTTRFMAALFVRGQEIGAVREDLPLETIGRLMHAIGHVLFADIVEERGVDLQDLQDAEVCSRIGKFMKIMHDLSQRILTPEEVRHV